MTLGLVGKSWNLVGARHLDPRPAIKMPAAGPTKRPLKRFRNAGCVRYDQSQVEAKRKLRKMTPPSRPGTAGLALSPRGGSFRG